MQLGKHVVDKALLDRNGRRAGMVDDLVLAVPDPVAEPERLPVVEAIVSGPLAAARGIPFPAARLARWLYRLLGVREPRPVEIPWKRVTLIDVVVHVDVERQAAGLTLLSDAVERQIIGRLPGA